jgi:hypothetical protein
MTNETPNTKHQTPEKHQTPNTKAKRTRRLELGVWSFSGVWCLVFGVSSLCLASFR